MRFVIFSMDVGKYVSFLRLKSSVVTLSNSVCSVYVHILSNLKEGAIGLSSSVTVKLGFIRKDRIDSGKDVR